MMRNRLISLITLCGALLGSLPVAAEPTVARYEVYEIVLTGSPNDNPYLTYRLWAEFHGSSGRDFNIEGFWDGGQTWKIRVALTEVGTWSYTTHSDDPLLDGQTGTVECTAGIGKGFIEQSGRHFFYSDGTPFFRMGDTCWRMFRSKNAPYETHFKPYIDARASQGFNFIMGVIHTAGEPSINEGGSLWDNDNDLDRLQPGYFQWVDKRINYMRKAGIVPGILLVWSDTFDDFYQPPYNRDTFSRFRRYIVARYAAYNLFWIVCGEYTESMTPGDYDYHAECIRYGNSDPARGLLDCGDPYDHPLSIHPGGQVSNSKNMDIFQDWLMYCMQQVYGSPSFIHNRLMQDEHHDLPLCNDEFGYEGPTDPKDSYYFYNNQSAVETRRDAWTIVCSGGYFTWGNIYTYTGKELVLRTDKLKTAGADYMRLLAAFIDQGVPLTAMRSDQARVLKGEAYCLSHDDELYMIYFPGAVEATVQLGAGGTFYQAFWYNPATGDSVKMGGITGGVAYPLTPPFGHDGVLYAAKIDEHTVALDLLSFTAQSEERGVRLRWRYAGEALAGFGVERSAADVFAPVARLIPYEPPPENSPTAYAFLDSTAGGLSNPSYRLSAVTLDGETRVLAVASCSTTQSVVAEPPTRVTLLQGFPNPSNGATQVMIQLPSNAFVAVAVYAVDGRLIRTLRRGSLNAGQTALNWDGRDDAGNDVPSGIYLVSLTGADGQQTLKLTLVR